MARNNDNQSLWKSCFGVGSASSSIFLIASIIFGLTAVADECGMFNDRNNLYEDTRLVASSEEIGVVTDNLEEILEVKN